jgi:hypothetical protein
VLILVISLLVRFFEANIIIRTTLSIPSVEIQSAKLQGQTPIRCESPLGSNWLKSCAAKDLVEAVQEKL